MRKITIEEHFLTEEYVEYVRSEAPRLEFTKDGRPSGFESLKIMNSEVLRKCCDLGEGRLRDMDEAGIDMQVLSLHNPGLEPFDASTAIPMAKKINDMLAKVARAYPKRLAGFASLPLQDTDAAAEELTRAVKELGLKGAYINSHIKGEYLDDPKYRGILETAERLGVPIYIHPRPPSPDMLKPYLTYKPLSHSMWGFAAETGLHAMRLIVSGVFDRFPGLKIILGHLGEGLAFWLWRIDNRWVRQGHASDPLFSKLKKKPGEYIKENFFVTTSGMFWEPAFLCVYLALGADKIMFAVDSPTESNSEAVSFIESLSICDADKEKIAHANAESLLGL